MRYVAGLYHFALLAGLAVLSAEVSGCSKAQVSVSEAPSSSYGVWILAFQQKPQGLWATDGTGSAYTHTRAVNFTGTCSRGVASVEVTQGAAPTLGSNAPCDGSGNFSWSYTFSSDSTYPLEFHPISQDGTVFPISDNQSVTVDTIPPAAPVITTNGGANFASGTSSVTLNGTISADTVSMLAPAGGTLTVNTATDTFSWITTMSAGQNSTFSFYAYDLAGNESAAASIGVSYDASTTLGLLAFSNMYSGPTMTGGSGTTLENMSTTPVVSLAPLVSTPNSVSYVNGVAQIGSDEDIP